LQTGFRRNGKDLSQAAALFLRDYPALPLIAVVPDIEKSRFDFAGMSSNRTRYHASSQKKAYVCTRGRNAKFI